MQYWTAVCKPEEVIAQLASMLIRSQLDQVFYLGHTLAKMLINLKRLRYEKNRRVGGFNFVLPGRGNCDKKLLDTANFYKEQIFKCCKRKSH